MILRLPRRLGGDTSIYMLFWASIFSAVVGSQVAIVWVLVKILKYLKDYEQLH